MENPILERSRAWIETFVIGLNLCPFAAPVVEGGRLRLHLSEADDPETLYGDFLTELSLLAGTDPRDVETSVIVHPNTLADFEDYLAFLDIVEEVLEASGLEGVVQVAGFHPDYRFAGVPADDPGNHTNRSPYPMLHLLREDSVSNALSVYENPEEIPERNVETMRGLGLDRIREMLAGLGGS